MLLSAAEREVDEYQGRARHQRSVQFRGHRNGDQNGEGVDPTKSLQITDSDRTRSFPTSR